MLAPKKMLQRLWTALLQVKAANTSENLLNEIRQIIYSLYLAKVTEKVYKNIMNSVKIWYNNAILINSENSKTFDLRKLLIKIDLKRKDKYIDLSNRSIWYKWYNVKKSYKKNKFKMSVTKRKEKFELPDGSYSISDI